MTMSEYKLVPVEPTDEMIAAYTKYGSESPYSEPYETSVTGYYKAMLSASPTTDTVTIDRAEYEAMKELITLIKVARPWYWVKGDLQDENRNHNLYPTKHGGSTVPMWVAINKQIEAIDQARKI